MKQTYFSIIFSIYFLVTHFTLESLADHSPVRHYRHKKRMVDDFTGSVEPASNEIKDPDNDQHSSGFNGKYYCPYGIATRFLYAYMILISINHVHLGLKYSANSSKQRATNIAQKAAQEAKAATDAQAVAGQQASHQVKAQLAEKALQAAKAAEAALAGKQSIVEQMEQQVREAESVVQEEGSSLQQAQSNVNAAMQAAQQATTQVRRQIVYGACGTAIYISFFVSATAVENTNGCRTNCSGKCWQLGTSRSGSPTRIVGENAIARSGQESC